MPFRNRIVLAAATLLAGACRTAAPVAMPSGVTPAARIHDDIAFLADDTQSPFINGHALSVDGGWATDGSWESLRLSKR